MIEATYIYARFAVEVYDDFGDVNEEQEYYRKEHADKEFRKIKHALWMARAERAKWVGDNDDALADYCVKHPMTYLLAEPFDEWNQKWKFVERKCREYAEKFK